MRAGEKSKDGEEESANDFGIEIGSECGADEAKKKMRRESESESLFFLRK